MRTRLRGSGSATTSRRGSAARRWSLQQFGFSYQKFQPNYRQGFGHVHKEQEELYLVIGGSGRVKVADDIVELSNGTRSASSRA